MQIHEHPQILAAVMQKPGRNQAGYQALLYRVLRLLCLLPLLAGCGSQAPEHPRVEPTGEAIVLPLSLVNDGGVHFFTYKSGGRNINFFVRTDGEGRLHTHFDACYSCYKYKKGFVREGGQVVCIACRIGYKLQERVWDYVGACTPMPLRSRRTADGLVISLADLQQGRRFF
jgi:uncharacterized membrane protein